MRIIESKQVGELSYMTDYIDSLLFILDEESIYRAREAEYNPNTNRKEFYVSMSRNLTSAAQRNPKRWKFGVIVDGDKLSEKYEITPVSYIGTQFTHSDVKVKYVTAYDNNTYVLNLVNWPTISIDKNTYDSIVKEIENMPEQDKVKHKLIHTGVGSRTINGRKVKEKYLFNVPKGGLRLNYNKYPQICSSIASHTIANEEEERVWITDNNYYIDISGCIKGIIMPHNLTMEEEQDFIEVQRVMKKLGISRIVRY